MVNTVIAEFIEQSIFRLEENTQRIRKCLEEINEEEAWQYPNEHLNSVGNLILHLCGNIRQYVISTLGEAEDNRDRDKEFSTKAGPSKAMLFHELSGTVAEAVDVIKKTDENKLRHVYIVQGYNLSGIGIVIHVAEHYSYHTGQIVFWIKQLKNKDMGFYKGIDLNVKSRH